MSIEKVLITGSKGVVGRVLVKGLKPHFQIYEADLPNVDLRDKSIVESVMRDKDAVVHLAWNKRGIVNGRETIYDDSGSENIDPENLKMGLNIYQIARELDLKRVVMASSGQADGFQYWIGPGLMQPDAVPNPRWPYGASKVWLEMVGKSFAKEHGLEVVCARFGAVRSDNLPPQGEEHVYLSHSDLTEAIKSVLLADKIAGNFEIFYAMSDNPGRIHSLRNSFGWTPKPR